MQKLKAHPTILLVTQWEGKLTEPEDGLLPRVRNPSQVRPLLRPEEWTLVEREMYGELVHLSRAGSLVYSILLLTVTWASGDLETKPELYWTLVVLLALVGGVRFWHMARFEQSYAKGVRHFNRRFWLGQLISLSLWQFGVCSSIYIHGTGWPGMMLFVCSVAIAAFASFAVASKPSSVTWLTLVFIVPPSASLALFGGMEGQASGALGMLQMLFCVLTAQKYSERFWSNQLSQVLAHRYAVQMEAAHLELSSARQAHSRFLSRMSHEMRTPLNGICGFAQLMLEDPDVGDREEIDYIMQSSERLRRLFDHLFLVIDIDAGKTPSEMRKIDISGLAKECEDALSDEIARAQLKLHWDFRSDVQAIVPARILRFVLDELLHNICLHSRAKEATIRVEFDQKEVFVDVSDNGLGIPEKYRGQLFKRFESGLLSSTYHGEGAGLGLALCSELVGSVCGSLEMVQSSVRGTQFRLRLPATSVGENDRVELETTAA